MKISIDYRAEWGETVCISGDIPELGAWDESQAIAMTCVSQERWQLALNVRVTGFQYRYLIKRGAEIIRREWGHPHTIATIPDKTYLIKDLWQDIPQQLHLYSSAFTEVFFRHNINADTPYYNTTILLNVDCPYVQQGQELCMCGASSFLGEWDTRKALRLRYNGGVQWQISLDGAQVQEVLAYKFIICTESSGTCIHLEEGDNRQLISPVAATIQKEQLAYRYSNFNWRGTGVSIPVFSLRTNESFGIGEFSDLKKLVDWAAVTGQQVIQLLPVNDTTLTYTWHDSYPYNAISIYALHPIYLGLYEHPLENETLCKKYRKEAIALNLLENVDYDQVITLKQAYFKALFAEKGESVMNGAGFLAFYNQNKDWLFPYACFSYLRDTYHTADYTQWDEYKLYDREKLERLIGYNTAIRLSCFIQYLLHLQLLEAKEYASRNGVILKGDIPIGVNRNSVETWVEPHLFHLDVQTGAPPDSFSMFGQNWGFPTYNWPEMAKDGYQWWIKRFRKMADYFNAYRIDHILGFFRIWEIPKSSLQGLLGYFSPALPLSVEEIRQFGVNFDVRMTQPYIHRSFLQAIFGEDTQEVTQTYLRSIDGDEDLFQLDSLCDTQLKTEQLFRGKHDLKTDNIREGLYRLCNEVLFVEDPEGGYHPRIAVQSAHVFKSLHPDIQNSFNRLYDYFFYSRHSRFWQNEAMKKLPVLVSATSMLTCGEDLGMIPESVPAVMQHLQILSLEIERMPKEQSMFADLHTLPYLSVCTTSTHDMSPLRTWWLENSSITQTYYNDILKHSGYAPDECTPSVCREIVTNHLQSPAMLVILPLQDWLSVSSDLRIPDPTGERINVPANPLHYWRYRMHLTLEKLLDSPHYNQLVKEMTACRHHFCQILPTGII